MARYKLPQHPRTRVVLTHEPRPELSRPGRRVAVLVAHGMGQQVRFETLDLVARALIAQAGLAHPGGDVPLAVRLVEHAGQWYPRAEIEVPRLDGGSCEVHLYEAYWAPLAEGQIRTWEVYRFLIGAALAAIAHVALGGTRARRFTRLMFGDWQRFAIPWRSVLTLSGAVLVLLGIAGGDAAALAALLSRTFHGAFVPSAGPFWLGAGALLLALSVPLRTFLLEYVGDVAIYVSSYKVNRFFRARDDIQRAALDVARCVYELQDGAGRPVYEHVVVAGHSLGSVVAYDTLNAILRTSSDPLAPGGPAQRTRALITFGSPLDKTAFVFRTQKSETSEVREALAAAVQPLIADYRVRPARWLNIWSPNDPVSGSLEFYDADETHLADAHVAPYRSRFVENVVDPEARTPGLAHVQYWNNALLARELYREVTRD